MRSRHLFGFKIESLKTRKNNNVMVRCVKDATLDICITFYLNKCFEVWMPCHECER